MSVDEPKENTANKAPEHGLKGLQSREPALVTLFSDLTGVSESQARSAFMFVSSAHEESKAPRPD
jgi:hypothetical protein